MLDRTPAQQVTRSRSLPVPSACSVYLFLGGAIVGATLMAIAIALVTLGPKD